MERGAVWSGNIWTLRMDGIKVLEAFEMWIWRRMEKISWTEHITNEEVLKRVDESRSLLQVIRERQHKWIGHILRGDSMLTMILEGRLKGRKTRGRPRDMLLNWMMDEGNNEGYKRLKNEGNPKQNGMAKLPKDLHPAENLRRRLNSSCGRYKFDFSNLK